MTVTLRSIGRWKRDDEVKACEGCTSSFGFLTRRHHCRSCGGIFCGACANKELLLPVVDKKKLQRVCGSCFARLQPTSSLGSTPALTHAPAPSQQQQTSVESAPPKSHEPASEQCKNRLGDDLPQSQPVGKTIQVASDRPTSQQQQPFQFEVNRETDSAPHASERCHENDSDSEGSDDFDRPPDMASRIASAMVSGQVISTRSVHNLSFLSALQDGLKQCDADNVLNILLFAGPERQQTMVVTVEAHETMEDVAIRLTEMYFKLENPPFRRMTAEAAESLREKLRFSSEHQLIEPSTEATSVSSQCKNVVLSTMSLESLGVLCKGGKNVSERSLRDFWRSERSDHGDAAVPGVW